MDSIFDIQFQPSKIIDNPSDESLREWALEHGGIVTEFGNLAVVTRIRNRMAKFTEVIMGDPEPDDLELVRQVLDYIKGQELIMLDRTMCQTPGFKKRCRLYVTSEYARLPLMWGNTLFPAESGEPDFVAITVPEWDEKKVLVFPEKGLTIILGSDYKGENKKAMLRQIMYWEKKKGNLGLHAASKILRIYRDNQLRDISFLIFGASGTGKTTLSCHAHWLHFPERVFIRQDDVVILRHDGKAIGTEESFYLKTDALEPGMQPLLYAAAISPRAILENVFVNPETAKVDFFDSSLTSNGRAMVKRRDIAFTDAKIDIDKVDCIIFITRHYETTPPIVRLSPEWAAAAFMLGESIETSAGDPTKAGEGVRIVGTNPFIVGPYAEEGNIFLDILRQNPGIQCFVVNTGKVGGRERGQKITVKDSVKILEMVARDQIAWRKDDFWGYEVPTSIPGVDLDRFNIRNYYTEEQIEAIRNNLRKERIAWLEQFPDLDPAILNAVK